MRKAIHGEEPLRDSHRMLDLQVFRQKFKLRDARIIQSTLILPRSKQHLLGAADNFCASVEVDNKSQRTEAGSEEIVEKIERTASFASKDAAPKIVVEEKAKHFIRLFRRSLKRQFDDIYKRKHYHWVDSVVREKTNKFFTTTLDIAGITPELYKENECNFFMLMHPSVDRKVLKKSKRNDEPWFE